MKKTLFLSAILATALCSSAFGATAITVGENETRDISTELTAATGIELTLANGATVTNTSKNYGSGSGDWGKQISSVTLASGATATLDVSGTANSTGVGIVRSGLGEVAVNLNGGTLVKTGTGQTIMYHVTTGDSAGTIQVDNGRLRFDGTGYAFHGTNANLVVNESGSLYFNNLESTMKTLTTSGEVIVASGGGTKVNGTFTTNAGSTTTINNGTTLTVKGLNTTGGLIQGAGTLFVDAGTSANNTTLDFDYISTTNTKISLKQAHGTLKAADAPIAAAITLTNDSWAAAEWVNVEGSSYTFNGAISGSGNQVFSGKNGLKEVALTFNGNLSGWNSTGSGYNGLRAASGMTLNVTLGGTLTGNNAIVANAFNADSDSKLNLTIDREATLKGKSNITSLTVNSNKTAKLQATATVGTMTLNSALQLLDNANLTTGAFTGTLKVAGNSTITLKGNGGTINNSGAHTATINVGGNSDVSLYAIYEDAPNVGRGTFNVVLNNGGHKTTVTNWLTTKNVTIKNGEDLSLNFHTIENLSVEKGESTVSTTANIGVDQHVISHVNVAGGAALTFNRQNVASVTSLTLGSGSTLTLGSEESHDFDLTTTGLTVNGDANLNANLVMNSGTMVFANNTTLTMGCSVTIGNAADGTVTVELTEEMVATIAGGGRVELFTSVDTATLGSHIVFTGTNGAALDKADVYSLQYDEATKTIYATPEPATATLSLLALAALAARRKRH